MISDAERLARYEAGADASPRRPGDRLTPGQLWHQLLVMPPDQRAGKLAHIIGNADVVYACFAENHRGTIEELRVRCERLSSAAKDLR